VRRRGLGPGENPRRGGGWKKRNLPKKKKESFFSMPIAKGGVKEAARGKNTAWERERFVIGKRRSPQNSRGKHS